MSFINSDIKNLIIEKLGSIINYSDSEWDNISLDIKLKIINYYGNFFNQNNNINYINLKSSKPNQFIQLFNINKLNNNDKLEEFKTNILIYTRKFRELRKNKNYVTFSNLPKIKYFEIINEYTNIIYNFLIKNKKKLDINNFIKKVISNNLNFINIKKFKLLKIEKENNIIILKFNNDFTIKLELYFYSNKITNNIPAKFKIYLLNNFFI
jgi:hypothetical protein